MNCKPNDMAIVASTLGHPAAIPLLGAIVTVLCVSEVDWRYGPMWRIEGILRLRGIACNVIADSMLKPLLDPGEDAVDEMVLRKPVPLPLIQPELLPERARA